MRRRVVIVCLGKRLCDNKITEEYKARIKRMIEVITDLRERSAEIYLIGFSGGCSKPGWQTEAEAGRGYFISQLDPTLRKLLIDRIFIDPYADSTIQNTRNICAELQRQGVDLQGVHLILISSGYHIDRILMIDRLMPLQSLCGPLHRLFGKLSFYRAPYPHRCKREAKVYLLKDLLTIMRVNLEGVCGIVKGRQGYQDVGVTVDGLIPENVKLFGSIVNELSQIGKESGLEENQIRTLEANIPALSDCSHIFRELGNGVLFLNEDDRKSLREAYEKLDGVIKELDNFDPD